MHSIIISILITLCVARPAPTLQGPAPVNLIDKAEKSDATIEKRELGGVRLSNGKNFTGSPWYGVYAINDCIALND